MNERADYSIILSMVEPHAKVLDIGCESGALLALLREKKQVKGSGLELSREGVNASLAKGLSVIQGDADKDLHYYPDKSFDYVILSQTLQATQKPREVIQNILRIGKAGIIAIPNFGYWRLRLQFLFKGVMPTSNTLPYQWYDTPNIHFCTLKDFVELAQAENIELVQAVGLNESGKKIGVNAPWWFWNIFAENAIFLIRSKV